MKHHISQKTKRKQRRGKGRGAEYRPEIRVNEMKGHLGTHIVQRDHKTKRDMHFLSQGEAMLYNILRFEDTVVDIREQYPLPIESTEIIAAQIGKRHPMVRGEKVPFTIDILADFADGHSEAFSVKASESEFTKNLSQVENVYIMKLYCESVGIPFHQVYTDKINRAYAENISRILYYWDPDVVEDKVGLFKHLLAHKCIEIDLESDVIDVLQFRRMADEAISDEQYLLHMEKINGVKHLRSKTEPNL